MPVFGPRGLVVVGVHAQAEADNGVYVVEKGGLSVPMAFDLEREITRYYRQPGSVFPLHIVVGPQGELLHVDNNSDLQTLAAALEQLLPE